MRSKKEKAKRRTLAQNKTRKADLFPSLSLKMNNTSLKEIVQVSIPLENEKRILDQKYTNIKTIRTNL